MQLRKPITRRESIMNIAPLIDVVFLLIIFMAVVSHITQMEIEDITLPRADQGRLEEQADPSRVVINIKQDGRISLAGAAWSLESLDMLLADAVRQRQGGEVSVVVRGDRETPWRRIAEVLRCCRAHGIVQLKVAVVNQDGDSGVAVSAESVEGGG